MRQKRYIKLLILSICLLLCSCSTARYDIKDYQYIYDVIYDWNKTMSKSAKRDNLLGYDEYLYNSFLILFPRDTPSTLTEFYYHWTQLIDYDGFAIYFTCKLTQENYNNYVDGLEKFYIDYDEEKIYLLEDNSHFEYPAYIAQWWHVGGKHEVKEYILLDSANTTVICVYTMGETSYIEKNSTYQISSTTENILSEEDYNCSGGFSIYGLQSLNKNYFEKGNYDNSFLNYLL